MSLDKQALAQRFLALGSAEQQRFLSVLQEKGIRFDRLPVVKSPRLGRIPLAPAQQRLWMLHRMQPDNSAYHMAGAFEVHGDLNIADLRAALSDVIARHEVLRTRFIEFNDEPWQVIDEGSEPHLTELDLRDADESTVRHLADEHAAKPFDLGKGPLLRVQLMRLGERHRRLQVVMHHIISDGWSIGILLKELGLAWRGRAAGGGALLPELTVQYADYAVWQRAWLDAGERERQLAFWREQLQAGQPPLLMPHDIPVDESALRPAAHQSFVLNQAQADALRQLARDCDATLFSALLAAWMWALFSDSGKDDLPIGVPVANRQRAEIAPLIGFFVNTQVLRGRPEAAQSVRDWITAVQQRVLDAQDHQALPFDQLVEALAPQRSPGEVPLFQVLFNHQQRDDQALELLPGVRLEPQAQGVPHALFDLALDIEERSNGELKATITYAQDRFFESSINRLNSGLQQALQQFVARPASPLAQLNLLNEQQQACLQVWSVQPYDYAQAQTLPGLISAQAAARPESMALVHGDTRLSYAELEARSNQLAHWLIAQGIGADQVVGLSLPRGVEMIVGFLGVLKAGGAFLPLDPDYPQERLCYMLEDSGAKLLLTNKALLNALPVDGLRRVALDDLDLIHQPDNTPRIQLHADQLAYLIYTSGSTGKPKGVCLTHAGLNMHVQTIGERYGMTPEDVELHFASISFDGAVERWTVPLAFGSRLVIRDQQLWSAEETCQALQKEGVTIACFPPSYVGPLLDWIEHSQPELKVRSWTLGGEAFTRETYERLQQVLKPQRIINGYGPTETVVTPMIWEAYADTDMDSAYAPIGTAVGERRLYILDGNLNPVAPGIVGELYIGGEIGLARGYHGRPDLTAERFLPDPWGEAGERMYRTGDLVRWREDGVMEYQGRVDHQIKIRGFRIELGEIEARLLANPQVAEATVVAQAAPGGDRLVGYVVPKGPLDLEQLKGDLESVLPDYMVPSQILSLDSLPLTPAGKVDRAALPQAQWQQQAYEAPQTEAEKALAQIWAQLLGVERIGRQDQFFELGGDSIIALQVVSRARQAGWALTPQDLFQQRSLSALASVALAVSTQPARQEELSGNADLTPIQAHFFAMRQAQPSHWNQHVWLSLKTPLQAAALETALQGLRHHHDALRLCFSEENGGWKQAYLPTDRCRMPILWTRSAADEAAVEHLCDEAQQSLNIETGELMRALYVRSTDPAEQADRLLLVIHHLAVDGVSWRILLEDLLSAYRQAEAGEAVQLPAKSHSLADWSDALRNWANSPAAAERLAFWQAQDNAQPGDAVCYADSEQQNQTLSESLTRQLLHQAPLQLQAALPAIVLHALLQASGKEALNVFLEGHGRSTQLGAGLDISRTVGWFTSLYPLTLHTGDLNALNGRLQQADEDGGVSYGALRYLAGADLCGHAELTFNYLGQYRDTTMADWFEPIPGGGQPQAADNPMLTPLMINAQVMDGRLSIGWTYSREHYSEAQIQHWMRALEQSLNTMLQHRPYSRPKADARLLMTLNAEVADRAPLFCIHPVTGRVTGYQALAQRLAGQRTLIGLQSRSFVDHGSFDHSFADMAGRYLATIRARQPQGPYYLLGWSLGGALCMEVAARLEEAGEEVAFLGLLDSYVPGFEVAEDQWSSPQAQQRLAEHLGLLLPETPPSRIQTLIEAFDQQPPSEWPQCFADWQSAQRLDEMSADNAAQLLYAWAVEQHYRRLCDGYRLPTIHTAAHTWWASEPTGRAEDLRGGIEAYLSPAHSRTVAADHLGIVREAQCLGELQSLLCKKEG